MKMQGAIYARLSREDEDKIDSSKDSRSIANQIKALTNYANENDIEIIKIYYDDGYSGSNLNRPSFQEMLKDIKNHKFNVLLIKDLSRLGRVMHQVGELIEHFFPDNNIRVISLNDNYDSNHYNGESIVLRNFLNAFYLKDFKKKCRKALERRAKTKHLNYYPKYGYRFNEEKKEQIDPYSSQIVKKIFLYASNGKTTSQIAKLLNEAKILTRSHYAVEVLGAKPLNKNPSNKWKAEKVWEIIKDYEYCGHSLNLLKKEPPILVRNTHYAIISEELFKKANDQLLSRNKKETNINHLGSILKDAISDKKMSYYQSNKDAFYYCKGCGYIVKAKLLHLLLYQEVLDLIKNGLVANNMIRKCYKKRLFKTSFIERNDLEVKLATLNEKFAKLFVDFFAKENTSDDFGYKSQELVQQIKDVEEKLKAFNSDEAKVTIYENKFINFIESLKTRPEIEMDLIKMVVSNVLLSKAKDSKIIDVTIIYKVAKI